MNFVVVIRYEPVLLLDYELNCSQNITWVYRFYYNRILGLNIYLQCKAVEKPQNKFLIKTHNLRIMKKQFIISALVFVAAIFGAQNAMAQSPTTTTEIQIILADVIAIENDSKAAGGQVDFTYNSVDDYNSTKTANVPNSLIVTSTKSFDINVKANGEHFENGQETIPVNVVTIIPVEGGTTTMEGTFTPVVLSTSNQKLITGASLGSKLVVDLEYEIPEVKSSSPDILGKTAGTYTQTVTYTATAL